jgi:MIP family channel proteins
MEDTMNAKLRPALAELVGTFLFIFIGAGSLIVDRYTRGSLGLVGVSLAHGLALAIMISAMGAISGGHLNPAVTLGLWVIRKVNFTTLWTYVVAQLIGGALAGYLLRLLFAQSLWRTVHMGTPTLSVGVTPLVALILEAVLTFFLMLAVLGTVVDSKAPKLGGWAVGLALSAGIFVAGPITGAALNPARVFGPALAAGFWEYHWIYWIGPLAGAALASWLYARFISKTI